MSEVPGAEPDEPQDDPDYRPPEPEDAIPPEYRHLAARRAASNSQAFAGPGYAGAPLAGAAPIEVRPVPFRFKAAAYAAAGIWPFAAALLTAGGHGTSPWLEPLSLASMGGLYASGGLLRALRRELSPENDTPVRRSTLAALFGLFLVLAVLIGVLRGIFIDIFGY